MLSCSPPAGDGVDEGDIQSHEKTGIISMDSIFAKSLEQNFTRGTIRNMNIKY